MSKYSELSHCGRFVAEINASNVLLVKNIGGELIKSYNLAEIVSEFLPKATKTLAISQLTWEIVPEIYTTVSSKLGVVIDSHSLLIIFDIRAEDGPIIIQQSITEGIEKFEWIPPIEEQTQVVDSEDPSKQGEIIKGAISKHNDQSITGYINSKQLVIFTKNHLKVKLYSLDCTHIILQLIKPLISKIIIRPKGNIWSVICDTREYNQPPVMYHFQNQGSISTLIHKFRFPVHLSSSSNLFQWSPDGKWLSWFSDTEKLFGFNLQVFPLLGSGNPAVGKPVLSINWLEDGVKLMESKRSNILISSQNYFCNWLQKDILISSINNNHLQFFVISMNLLRICYKFEVKLASIKNIWRQITDTTSVKYRNFPQITLSTHLKAVHTHKSCVVVQLEGAIIVYELTNQENNINGTKQKFDLQTCISITLPIVSIKIYDINGKVEVTVFTTDHIVVFREGVIQVVYHSNEVRIEQGFIKLDDGAQILMMTSSAYQTGWEVLDMDVAVSQESPKRKFTDLDIFQKQAKRRLLEGLVNTSIEITDTFATRKRASELNHLNEPSAV